MPLKYLPLVLVLAGCLGIAGTVRAAEDHAQDEQAIRAAADQYAKALERGDTKTILGLWTPEGDIIDEYGRSTPARELFSRETAASDSNGSGHSAAAPSAVSQSPPSQVKVTDTSLRFVTADVAIEDGQVDVTRAAGLPPVSGRFTAIWVKRDGAWKLASLREVRLPAAGGSDLAALDWMVGRWTGQGGKATFDMNTQWNEQHTYLLRDLRVTHDGKVILSGQQRIGIDPADGRIKSWMHDTDGGHGEGTWTRHGDSWLVQATGVSPDGRHTTATNVYTHDGADTFTWKSFGGTSNGQPTEDFEITLHRIKGVE